MLNMSLLIQWPARVDGLLSVAAWTESSPIKTIILIFGVDVGLGFEPGLNTNLTRTILNLISP